MVLQVRLAVQAVVTAPPILLNLHLLQRVQEPQVKVTMVA
jgi:hypothetical protein